jgi:hypothetical protein
MEAGTGMAPPWRSVTKYSYCTVEVWSIMRDWKISSER